MEWYIDLIDKEVEWDHSHVSTLRAVFCFRWVEQKLHVTLKKLKAADLFLLST